MIFRFRRAFPTSLLLVVTLLISCFRAETARAYTCSMQGPAGMAVGTRAIYSAAVDNTVLEVNWTITGHGVIVTRTLATSVIVESGTIGTFELVAHVTLAADGSVVDCVRTIQVLALDCTISGDTEAMEHGPLRYYGIPMPSTGVTIQWQISGNGVLSSDTHSYQVVVAPGAAGQYVISVTLTSETLVSSTCSMTVPVAYNPALPHPNRDAKLMIHLGPTTVKNACGLAPPECYQAVTAGALYPRVYYAYLLVEGGSATYGVGGIQCGIDYNAQPNAGVDVFGWTLCASLEFASAGPNGPWPAAGSGNLVTWDVSQHCQRYEPSGTGSGVAAKVGYFYVGAYSADQLRVTPRPADGLAKVAACDGTEDVIAGPGTPNPTPSHLGSAQFSPGGVAAGYNPCTGVIPVVPTTWSAIKGLYAR